MSLRDHNMTCSWSYFKSLMLQSIVNSRTRSVATTGQSEASYKTPTNQNARALELLAGGTGTQNRKKIPAPHSSEQKN